MSQKHGKNGVQIRPMHGLFDDLPKLHGEWLVIPALIRHRSLVICCIIIVGLSSAGIGWQIPQSYTAKTTILATGLVDLKARGELENGSTRRLELLARKARLTPEVDGESELRFPPELGQGTNAPHLAAILDAEKRMFISRQQELASNVRDSTSELALLHDKAQLLTEQAELIAKQQQLADKDVHNIQDLINRRLTLMPRLREAQSKVVTLEYRKLDVQAQMISTQQARNDVAQRIGLIKGRYKSEATEQQAIVEGQLRELSVRTQIAKAVGENSGAQADIGFVADQADIIVADQNILQTLRRLGLDKDELFLAAWSSSAVAMDDTEKLAALMESLRQRLSAKRTGQGSRVDIQLSWSDPKRAVEIANGLAATYLENQAGEGQFSKASILRSAALPLAPDHPLSRVVPAGMLIGLLIGIMLAYFEDQRTHENLQGRPARPSGLSGDGRLRMEDGSREDFI